MATGVLIFFCVVFHGQKIFNNTLLNIESVHRLPGNNVTAETLTNGIKDKKVQLYQIGRWRMHLI